VTLRGVPMLAVHVGGTDTKVMRPIEAAVRAAFGEAVGPAFCYWDEIESDAELAVWSADE
jgi:hypothetical protein